MNNKQASGIDFPTVSTFILGVCLSSFMMWSHYQSQAETQHRLMKRHAMVYTNAIENALERSQSVVEDLVALFNASDRVSRDEFEIFSRTQFKFKKAIQALEWIPKVPYRLREKFEAEARKHYPNFEFTEKNAQGKLVRAGYQENYYPVFYVSPYQGNELALGYSPENLTIRNLAMEQALVGATTVASSKIRLIQEKEQQMGMLIFAPVFETVAPPETIVQRRAQLKGFVLGVFRVGDLIASALKNQETFPLVIQFADLNHAVDQAPVYFYQNEMVQVKSNKTPAFINNTSLKIVEKVNKIGRSWQLLYSPRKDAYQAPLQTSMQILAIGLLLTLICTYITWLWHRKHKMLNLQLSNTVVAKEQALQEKDQTLIRQHKALSELTTNPWLLKQKLSDSLSDITRISAETLNVERVSVWLLSDNQELIRCFDLFELTSGKHSSGIELRRKEYPGYFKALHTGKIINASDATTDPRTCEFNEPYLSIIGITSMLDTPIIRNGKLVGVLCCEQVKTKRYWSPEEETFCHAIANVVSLAMESIERRQAEQRLKESSERLSIINTIATHVTAGMKVSELIAVVLKRLHHRFPNQRIYYGTVSDKGIFCIMDSLGPTDISSHINHKIDLSLCPDYFNLLQQRQTIAITDVKHDERMLALHKILQQEGSQAIVYVPILLDKKLIGILCLSTNKSRFWNENEILTLQETAEYLEFAIREAIGQEAREKAEHALENHKANLENLVHSRTLQLEHQAEFERLVANLSTKFIHLPAELLDIEINRALQQIGEFVQVDRCSLSHWYKQEKEIIKDFEWLANQASSMFPDNNKIDFSQFHWLTNRLLQKKISCFSTPEELPSEAQNELSFFQQHQVKSLCIIPLLYGMNLFGILCFSTANKERSWHNNELVLLTLTGEMLVNAFERKKYEDALKHSEQLLLQSNKKLEELVTIDALTNVANRRFFDLRLDAEFRRAIREKISIALIFFDIDYFKHYNDHFGHLAGDKCLVAIAQVLRQHFKRATESVCRYGGEEFVAIITNTSALEVGNCAEKTRKAVEQLQLSQGENCPAQYVTLSCGTAIIQPGLDDTPEELIQAADSALYLAKNSGRNCVRSRSAQGLKSLSDR